MSCLTWNICFLNSKHECKKNVQQNKARCGRKYSQLQLPKSVKWKKHSSQNELIFLLSHLIGAECPKKYGYLKLCVAAGSWGFAVDVGANIAVHVWLFIKYQNWVSDFLVPIHIIGKVQKGLEKAVRSFPMTRKALCGPWNLQKKWNGSYPGHVLNAPKN